MRKVVRLFVVVLVSLMGRSGGMTPISGYCINSHCFTVFQDAIDFAAAQSQCMKQDGHLMTLRSSVSHDILALLIANLTGSFWVGLHLPSGCPDAGAELKGFQWVTGDNKSDFSNWAPSFDISCSSRRCVSVSKTSDFKWTQEACDELATGFLCENSFSEVCSGLPGAVEGESVTYMTPLGFGGEDLLSLPLGSVAVRVPSGSKYVCDSGQWLPGPWSCEIHKGGCEYKCAVNSKQVPSCSCPPGQTVNAGNNVTCEAAADDPCVALRCAYACQHDGESYVCVCDRGLILAEDGRSCLDLDECADKRQCPGQNYKCVNTFGGFRCDCKDGYEMDGVRCVDEDECASAPCEHDCVNTPGSYKCTCSHGYIVDPESPNNCVLHCWTEECPAECDPNDDSQCNCPRGYIAEERDDGTFCLDIDECLFGYCDQSCENTFGSYMCACSPGFTLINQFKCVKSEDHKGSEAATAPNTPTTPCLTHPAPTKRPSAVSVLGLVGILFCAVFLVVLGVCLVYHFFNSENVKSAGAVKAHESEAHGL